MQIAKLGIVVGMVAQGNEKKSGEIKNSVDELIAYILKYTDYSIALIPHVNVGPALNDIIPERELYEKYKECGRIALIQEESADKLKYVILKCRMLITLRTHASIAAYSSEVPTLVLGYSIKSKGLAKDIFGEIEPYVLDINEDNLGKKLVSKFVSIDQNYDIVKGKLEEVIPEYKDKV